jgi:hypothetical protein
MNAFRVAVLLFVSTIAASFAEETNTLPTTITVDGVTYSNVTWRTVTPSTVTIFHKSGIATIPLEKLPPELKKQFGYDPQKVADLTRQQAQKVAEMQKAAQQATLRKRLREKQFREPLKIGDTGVIGGFTVAQVLDKDVMLVTFHLYSQSQLDEAKRVYGVDGVILGTPTFDRDALMKGFPTAGFVDGQHIEGNETMFRLTGTTNYVTVSGAPRTVYLVEPWKSEEPTLQQQ